MLINETASGGQAVGRAAGRLAVVGHSG